MGVVLMRELSLFSGAGGGLLGTKLLGWETVGYVEWEEYCQKIIAQRIKDGIFDNAPIHGDIRAFIDEGYAEAYQGMVDVVTAGFPCQPFSVAGKQRGIDDERNKWPETLECIRIVRPRFVFLENVPGLLAGSHGYFGHILRELAESGYNARWRVLSAAEVGAPHKRDRLWILAYSRCEYGHEGDSTGMEATKGERPPRDIHNQSGGTRFGEVGNTKHNGFSTSRDIEVPQRVAIGEASDIKQPSRSSEQRSPMAYSNGSKSTRLSIGAAEEIPITRDTGEYWWSIDPAELPDTDSGRSSGSGESKRSSDSKTKEAGKINRTVYDSNWPVESRVGRVADGVPNRANRLKAIGNGQVPAVVATAWRELTKGLLQ